MPTPAFCSLDEVYGDWNVDKTKQQRQNQLVKQNHPSLNPVKKDEEQDVYIPKNEDLRSFCPNCKNCLNANDALQQKIIEQNIYPRPRWEPQYPNAYVPYDPYNRYWASNQPSNTREDFGNLFENFGKKTNSNDILQLLLFILIALFIIQLIECISVRVSE